MRKIYSLLLMATMLLVSGNMWATTHTANDAESLKDAIAAAETGDIVQLTANIDLGANRLLIERSGVEFTLDLNGYNLKGDNSQYGILHMAHGTMTIMTSKDGGSIGEENVSQLTLNLSGGGYDGTVILQSGTIFGQNKVVSISSGNGKFIMNGGEIIVDGSTAAVYGLYLNSATGSTEINGGKISVGVSTDNVIVVGLNNAGTLTITDVEMRIRNTGNSDKTFAFTSNINGVELINGGKFVANGSTSGTTNKFFEKTTKIFGGKFGCDVQAWIPAGEPYMCQGNVGLGTCFGQVLTHEIVVNPAATACVRNVTQNKDYTSISKALAEAADHDELCLLVDLDFGQASLTVNRAITLDLNGQNLWGNTSAIYLTGGEDEGHTLVLTDKAADKGLIKGSSPIQLKGGYVKVENVVVNGTSYAINQAADGNYTIQNVEAVVKSLAKNAYVYKVATATTVIKDCNFTLDAANIPTGSSSSTYNSVFNGTTGALSINGGEYKVINLPSGDYAGIFYGTTTKNIVSIYDGEFYVVCDDMTNARISNATADNRKITLQIYGGKYNIDPTKWLVPGYVANAAEGIYTVEEGTVATVNGTPFATIDGAIAAAAQTAPASIELLHSTKLATTLDIPAGVTFAENGYTIELLNSTPLRLENGVAIPACVTNTNFVASISESNATRYFYSLSKGIAACEATETVKLLQDVTETIRITSGTKTIDFNGHNLTCSEKYMIDVTSGMLGESMVHVNFINNTTTESVLENTFAEAGQSEGLHVESKGIAVNATIGAGVTVKASTGVAVWKKVTLNVYGKVIAKKGFAIAGNGSAGNGGTTINIYDGAEVESPSTALYHPQVGTLNISGGEIISGNTALEVRGGDVTISGGTLRSTKTFADDDAISGGTSTTGAALGINPYENVTITITGGTFEAYKPFYQAQSTGVGKTISTTISGGYFKAINNGKSTIWAETTNKFIKGGFYNLSPAAYVADNKAVVPNADPVYKFAIADVKPAVTFVTAGQWSAADKWSAEVTSATPVVIAADCEIANGVVANVYGLTLNSGKTLTVKKGGKLIVGAEGLVNNAGAANLIIEDGAYVVINPVATNAAFAATVHHASQTRALTADEQATSAHGYNKLWEVCANPITTAAITFPAGLDVRASRWSNGWVGVNSLSEIATPYVAYMMATNAEARGTDIYWTGTTNGVANQSIAATNAGWYFVGNSYLAPIDIVEFIDNLGANVEKQIYMYKASTETFDPITRATAGKGNRFDVLNSVVEPISGFFVRATGATTIGLDYTQTVWDALNAKVAAAAPGRHKVIATPRNEIEHTAKMEFAVQSLDDETRYSVLDIFEAAAYTTSKQDDYDFTAFINPTPNINFVAEQYGVQLNTVSLPSLDGLTLAFNTGASTNLRIYFDNVEGATYYLYDAVANTYTEIVDGTYYDFTVAAATGNTMVGDRFQIVAAPAYDVTIGATGWATYCDDAVLGLPTGLQAYKAAYNAAGEELLLTEVSAINANEGVILKGAEGGYNFTVGTATDFSGNELAGTVDGEATPAGEVYCLHTQGGVTGFYKYVGANIPAHKAYFILPAATPAPSRVRVRIVSATTGVEEVSEMPVFEKYIENGNLYLQSNGCVVNAQGQVVK